VSLRTIIASFLLKSCAFNPAVVVQIDCSCQQSSWAAAAALFFAHTIMIAIYFGGIVLH